MDLEYGPEYQNFTKEVESFCEKYKGLSFTDGSNNPLKFRRFWWPPDV